MLIGNGEYLIISSCLKNPYDCNKIVGLIEEFRRIGATFGQANLLKINPEKVDYNIVWEGIEDFSAHLSIGLLHQYVLSTLELKFNNGIPARLQVMFVDELSYEVSLIFNYTQLIDEERETNLRTTRLGFIESIALVVFEILVPLYGTFGVERSIEGIESIIQNNLGLPSDKVFYNKKIISKFNDFKNLVKNVKYSQENNAGVYFRNSCLDDFQLVENEEIQITKLHELLESL